MKDSAVKPLTVAFLTLVILIDFIGMAMVVVVFPKLLIGDLGILPAATNQYLIMGFLLAIYPLGQIVGASALGKYSDRYGRKKILIGSLIGTLIGFCLSGLAINKSSIIMLFVSRLIAGLCAGNVAVAQAALIDVSTPQTRAKNISWGQMAMGLAYIVGPMLGGILSSKDVVAWFTLATPFWIFSAMVFLLIGLTILGFEETNTSPKTERINLFESVQQIYAGLSHKQMAGPFMIWLLFVSGWWLFESFMPTFLMTALHCNTKEIGEVLGFNGALYASFQYLVVQRLAEKTKPETMFKYAVGFAGLAIVALPFVITTIQLYAVMTVFVMAMGFAIPGLITFISNRANQQQQGEAMGIVSSIQAVATVGVMVLAGYLEAININLSIFLGGALIIISGLAFTRLNTPSNSKLMCAEISS